MFQNTNKLCWETLDFKTNIICYFCTGRAHQPDGSGRVLAIAALGRLSAGTRGRCSSSRSAGRHSGGRCPGGRSRGPRRKTPAVLPKPQRIQNKAVTSAERRWSVVQGKGVAQPV